MSYIIIQSYLDYSSPSSVAAEIGRAGMLYPSLAVYYAHYTKVGEFMHLIVEIS